MHERAQRERHHPRLGGLLGLVVLLQRLAAVEVDAAAEDPPEVLVAPHDALGEAGRAAGVDDVQVVLAALLEVALGALVGEAAGGDFVLRSIWKRNLKALDRLITAVD